MEWDRSCSETAIAPRSKRKTEIDYDETSFSVTPILSTQYLYFSDAGTVQSAATSMLRRQSVKKILIKTNPSITEVETTHVATVITTPTTQTYTTYLYVSLEYSTVIRPMGNAYITSTNMVLLKPVETETVDQGSGATTPAVTNAVQPATSAAAAAAANDGKRTGHSNHIAMEVALPIVICAIGVFLALFWTYKRRRNRSRVSPDGAQGEDGPSDPRQGLESTDYKSDLDQDNGMSPSFALSSPQKTHEKAGLSEEASKKLELEGQSAAASPQQPGEIAEAEGRAGLKPLTVELEG
ncbi:hypothetical protein LTR37_011325 [Vermiconidia calcicola]|uniref:Uncharacterized protein n=1 Tax=Vermiconidia calcicola TaxID=1690605 RepID=A0ACC3N2M2_9PEZI|nr:hypothetical protein LTR37_011325 [Vermiconidia calcicola]